MTTKDIMTMSLDDLIADAVARKDKQAILWIQKEAYKKDKRKKDDKEIEVAHSLTTLKFDYAKKYWGYTPKDKTKNYEELRRRAQEKKRKELEDKFAAALAALTDQDQGAAGSFF